MSKNALLLSGGIDSTALAYWKKPSIALTIDYGQASRAGEIRAAAKIAKELRIPHEIVRVDCAELGSGDLASKPPHDAAPASEWWPFRNQFLVTIAAMRSIALGVDHLILGSVNSDAFHIDGTREFYERIDSLLAMQEGHIRVEVPAIHVTSVELVRMSGITPALLGWTHSCHKGQYSCGFCRGCGKRRLVLSQLGYGDSQAC